jgi:hypothetical protein
MQVTFRNELNSEQLKWALDTEGKCNGRGGREFPALQVPLAFGHNAINPGGLGAQPPRRKASAFFLQLPS